MDINALRKAAAEYQIRVQHAKDAAEVVREYDEVLKTKGELTNAELRAVKKIVKATVNGTLDKHNEQAEAEQIIQDILINNSVVDKSVVESPETEQIDLETGEITENATYVSAGDYYHNSQTELANRGNLSQPLSKDELCEIPDICRRVS